MRNATCRVIGAWVGLLLVGRQAWSQSNDGNYSFTTLVRPAQGPAGAPLFNGLWGITVDSAGNLYVADRENDTIRKLTTNGQVTTLAGQPGVWGSADGTGSAALFYRPTAVAVDSAGNVFVADTVNNTIRKITAAGVVTTFAGQSQGGGSADGPGTQAQFYNPEGLALDGAGNLYVADTYNETIRKVSPEGVVTTLAGAPQVQGSADGAGGGARFTDPAGIGVDSAGTVYVADTGNHTIRRITAAGVVSTLAGLPGRRGMQDGIGSAARLAAPRSLAVDRFGNLYVADTMNNAIRKITPAGEVTTIPARADDGTSGVFYGPRGVAVDGAGNLFVADTGNGRIRQLTDVAGTWLAWTLAGQAHPQGAGDDTGGVTPLNAAMGVAVDNAGNVFVADYGNCTIWKVTAGGSVTSFAGVARSAGDTDGVGSAARFRAPAGLALDRAGNLYVADSGNATVRKITPAGGVTTLAGLAGNPGYADGTGRAARFVRPMGIAVDGTGNLYVADQGSDTVRKLSPDGVVTTVAGQPNTPGRLDGLGGAAQFNGPELLATDAAGNLYVADTGNATIRKVTPLGAVTTLAGRAGVQGDADGLRGAATFTSPWAVAVDGAGNLYVADSGNATIREVSAHGVVTTLAGSATNHGSIDGTGNAARFQLPWGVAVDPAGTLYVTDRNTLRKGFPAIRLPTAGADLGGSGGAFGFPLASPVGQAVVVEASGDLVNWAPVQTNNAGGAFNFTDPQSRTDAHRFYRAHAP